MSTQCSRRGRRATSFRRAPSHRSLRGMRVCYQGCVHEPELSSPSGRGTIALIVAVAGRPSCRSIARDRGDQAEGFQAGDVVDEPPAEPLVRGRSATPPLRRPEGYYEKYGAVGALLRRATPPRQGRVRRRDHSARRARLLDSLNVVTTAGCRSRSSAASRLTLPFQMWAKDDVKSAKDLKGRTVGITAPHRWFVDRRRVQFLEHERARGRRRDVGAAWARCPTSWPRSSSGRIDAARSRTPSTRPPRRPGASTSSANAARVRQLFHRRRRTGRRTTTTRSLAYLKGNTEGLVAYAHRS